jgi:hypothetical protein
MNVGMVTRKTISTLGFTEYLLKDALLDVLHTKYVLQISEPQ